MSHDGDLGKTCKFGHVIETVNTEWDEERDIPQELKENVEEGEIGDLDELEENHSLAGLCGPPHKTIKVSADSQGFPRTAVFLAADMFDDDLNYTANKVDESIFVSPQSNLHAEFMQRKSQAEQNVRETMRNISTLIKQKHMLEHDIRKLRSRAENMRSGDENVIKGDFIELVDGAGGAGQQGGDEASLKFYRDQNIYPSIVADFQEMQSIEDLEDGPLSDLPENEKAVLRKKWAMYEKWKDLYGSEVQRKLKDLKKQLRSIERSIEETRDWLEPYVRDVKMINERSTEQLKSDFGHYFTFRGTASQLRQINFIAYKPMVKEGGELVVIDDEENATHFRVVYIKALHINLAGWDQPQSPAGGPSVAKIFFHPVITCRHVFKNFFEEKIDRSAEQFQQLVNDYHGKLHTDKGDELRSAREEKDLTVRELREEVNKASSEPVPIEFSSAIRRVEDGIDTPNSIENQFGGEVMEALDQVLDTGFSKSEEEKDQMYHGVTRKLREFTGQVDEFWIPRNARYLTDYRNHFKFDFYYDYKIALGLNVVK